MTDYTLAISILMDKAEDYRILASRYADMDSTKTAELFNRMAHQIETAVTDALL